MKRFLLLFCTVVLVFSIMIVPAFASDLEVITVTDPRDFDSKSVQVNERFSGDYRVLFYDSSSEPFLITPVVFIDENRTTSYDFTGLLNNLSFHIEMDFLVEDDGRVFFCFPFWACSADECFMLSELFEISRIEFVPAAEYEPPAVDGGSPLSGIFDVFGGVGSWIVGQLGTTTSLFWNGQGLTFLGVLAVAALALAVVLLLVFVVVRFLRFRG